MYYCRQCHSLPRIHERGVIKVRCHVFILLSQGILLKWTKGIKASGCEGQDVIVLLKEAVHRRKVSAHVFRVKKRSFEWHSILSGKCSGR